VAATIALAATQYSKGALEEIEASTTRKAALKGNSHVTHRPSPAGQATLGRVQQGVTDEDR
jgi:hypothetical protein